VKNSPTISCKNDPRREAVRQAPGRYGLDYVELSTSQKTLHVTFLGRAPQNLQPGNFTISGGERIRHIRVIAVTQVSNTPDSGLDDTADIVVDRAGDFSNYVLTAVTADQHGQPTDQPLTGFDPLFDSVTFQFKANCPSDLDCKSPAICPPEVRNEPDINYLAKDYQSFRQLLLDRLALLVPAWQETHVPDLGIALVETLAYVGDHLSYYQDAVATEAYLRTARQRISVRRHARLVDYPMHEGCNARTWICVQTDTDTLPIAPTDIYFITNYPHAPAQRFVLKEPELEQVPASAYKIFEPVPALGVPPLQFYRGQSRISFYDWGNHECCLPRGATSAALRDVWTPQQTTTLPGDPTPASSPSSSPADTDSARSPKKIGGSAPAAAAPASAAALPSPPTSALRTKLPSLPNTALTPAAASRPRDLQNLKVGDVLMFQEVLGPLTGIPADADPTHRHAVVLTKVETAVDTLYTDEDPDGIPIVMIEWSRHDALPFPLCISSTTQAPGCKYLVDVSVACGNVVLVDHGHTLPPENLGAVPTLETNATCECACHPAETTLVPGIINPWLKQGPLTFVQPRAAGAPASSLLTQDPRACLAQIWLNGSQLSSDGKTTASNPWTLRRDLLESEATDRDFVVEMDDFGIARLRFGDGDCGAQPTAQATFTATYRVGTGPDGNVGAQTIRYLVFRNNSQDVNLKLCNPFPALGGTAPESVDQVKLLASHAFRSALERAVTADDYATIAARDPALQSAAACLRWNGSWYEALVAIDPFDSETPSRRLLHHVDRELCQYRRIGHDVAVCAAQYVPLDLAFKICVQPDYLRAHVEAALLDAFSNRLLPSGQSGFFFPDSLNFGGGIYVSKLLAAAQNVTGVESVCIIRLQRLYQGPNGEIAAGVLPIRAFEIARLDNDPSSPEHGQISFDLRGGR
jgi:hypothetical protein